MPRESAGMPDCAFERTTAPATDAIVRTTWRRAVREVRHAHDVARLVIVLDGDFDERAGDVSRNCGAGSAIFRPRGELHAARFAPAGGRYASLSLSESSVRAYRIARGGDGPGAHARNATLHALGLRLAREAFEPDPWSQLAIEGIALEVLCALGRAVAKPARRPSWFATVCERLREPPLGRLDELAAIANVSPARLSREFRLAAGMSVAAYARAARVEAARKLVRESDRSLADVAIEAGFADQSHLCRAFRRVLGTTPARYRDCARD